MGDIFKHRESIIVQAPNMKEIVLELQISAARYTYHRQMIHKYGERVRIGQLSIEDAGKMYEMAMDNYDGIIKAAADGASQEANEADMAEGFKL